MDRTIVRLHPLAGVYALLLVSHDTSTVRSKGTVESILFFCSKKTAVWLCSKAPIASKKVWTFAGVPYKFFFLKCCVCVFAVRGDG